MALDQETIGKLTTALAGDIELFNTVINNEQETVTLIAEKTQEIETIKSTLDETEQRSQQYLGQISNLLSKIPVGNANAPQSFDAKIEEIKNRDWVK